MDLDANVRRAQERRTLRCLILIVLAGGIGVGFLAGASLRWEAADRVDQPWDLIEALSD